MALNCGNGLFRTRPNPLEPDFQTDGAGSIPVARSTKPAGQTPFSRYVLDRSGSSETPLAPTYFDLKNPLG